MAKQKSFRVGRVTLYARGLAWYLSDFENGRRQQVRGIAEEDTARQLAAQVDAQLEVGAPAMTSFEALSLPELRSPP